MLNAIKLGVLHAYPDFGNFLTDFYTIPVTPRKSDRIPYVPLGQISFTSL